MWGGGDFNHGLHGFARMDFFFTTEYTEAWEPYLKITEKISVYSVWERSDLSVYSVVKKLPRMV